MLRRIVEFMAVFVVVATVMRVLAAISLPFPLRFMVGVVVATGCWRLVDHLRRICGLKSFIKV